MPTLKGPIQGNRSPYSLRSGIDVAELHGINKQKDPAAIDENQFQSATNVRLRGGRMWARGGQSKFNGAAMTASCVIGIFDFLATAVNMLIAPSGGGTPFFYNSNYMEQPTDPPTWPLPAGTFSYTVTTTFPGLYPSGLTPTGTTLVRRVFHKYRGQILALSSDGYVYRLLVDKASVTFPTLSAPGTATLIAEQLFKPADSYATALPNTSCEWQQKLWFASRDGHVYSWDGNVFVRDTSAALNGGKADGVIFRLFEDIYCAVNGGLYKRAGGAWSSVTLPGTLTNFYPRAAAVWQNNAYIIGGDVTGANNTDAVALKLASPSTCTEVARDVDGAGVAPTTAWLSGGSEVQVSGSGATIYFGFCRRNLLGENEALRADGVSGGLFTNTTTMIGTVSYGTTSAPQVGWIRFAPVGKHVVCVPANDSIGTTDYSIIRPGSPNLAVSDESTNTTTGEPFSWDAIVI